MPYSFLRTWSDKAWQLFISLKLTFVLLTVIGVGATIGMSFDQTVTYEEFYKSLPESGMWVWALSFFELYDTFHSWWFSLAILLLALNLIACSIERLPRIYFDAVRPRPFLTNRRLDGLSLQHTVMAHDKLHAQALVRGFNNRFSALKSIGSSEYFFCDTQWMGRFGVYIVHIALLIIMFSSIYATQNGVDGHVLIEEGKKTRFITAKGAGGVSYTHDLGFYVGCEDFRLRTFVDNSPMEYESDLFIEAGQEKRAAKTVRVNEPLSYQGYTFYQSSFKPMISENIVELEVIKNDGSKERRRVRLGEEWQLTDGTIIAAEKLYDDFAGIGQALRIAKKSPSSSTYFHIFRRYPEFDGAVRGDSFAVVFADVDQQYATGLSIGNVPGISFIFTGFLILLVGLYLCFFTSPTRYFARIDTTHDGIRVFLAAQGFRNLSFMRTDFARRIALGNQHG